MHAYVCVHVCDKTDLVIRPAHSHITHTHANKYTNGIHITMKLCL